MMSTRWVISLLAGLMSLLLMPPARAAPTVGNRPDVGPRLRLATPRLLAEFSRQPPATASLAEASGEDSAPGDDQQPPVDTRPYTMDYQPGQPIPPGYRVLSRPHRAQLTSGSIAFGISYTISVIMAASYTEASATAERYNQVPYSPRWLYLPLLGPWVALATARSHDCRNSYYASSYFYGQCEDANKNLMPWRALLIFDGILQGLGAYFTVWGIKQRWYQLVLNDDVQVQLLPVPMGLALVGRFRGF